LPIASTKTRRGYGIDGQEFAAYPGLVRDTVVFVPYPLRQFGSLPAREGSAARAAALGNNLGVLLEFTTEWTRRTPESSPAFQALAEVLDARGEITRSRSGGITALEAARRARASAVTQHERQLSAVKEAWLLFKEGDFTQARLLADSVLTNTALAGPEDAQALVGLAALTGKIAKTAELSRIANNYSAAAENVPIQVMDAAAPFFAFAALGVCGDSTRALERRLDEQLARYVAEDQENKVKTAVKARPLSMLVSCTGGRSVLGIDAAGVPLTTAQQDFANGDIRGVRTLLTLIAEDSRTQRPGDMSLDFTYQIAWLRSAIGDTAGAIRQLDRAIGALPSLSATMLRDAAAAAAAGRAMALRAEIAAARGDTNDRIKWARAVLQLWATADPPLQSVVVRMRTLANDR
jgi:tetratricopeptide (TPR) repeat protein